MVKVVNLADIHWRGISRHNEYTRSFETLFRQLSEEVKPDIIVNCGDVFHTKTQGITPEVVERLSWMFRNFASIAPTYTIIGNHDVAVKNLDRKDIITTVHSAINCQHSYVLKRSGSTKVDYENGYEYYFHTFSPFDMENWNQNKPVDKENAINIALLHGSINGCKLDNNESLYNGDISISDLKQYDFALLGDIHKQQYLSYRKDSNGDKKPWIAYPGSLIQQNFGEDETKGYLIWDIHSKDDWEVSFKELPNYEPFVTVPWVSSVEDTIKNIDNSRPDLSNKDKVRYRISLHDSVSSAELRQLEYELRQRNAVDFSTKSEHEKTLEQFKADNLQFQSITNKWDYICELYDEYVGVNRDSFPLTKKQKKTAHDIIKNYFKKVKEESQFQRNNYNWYIKDLCFDNLFGYEENNYIDFTKYNGVVGVFGPNRQGKSSFVGALLFVLYNTTDRGSMKNSNIINRNKNYCYGKVRINVGGTDYIIERKTERNLPKKKKNIKRSDYDKTITSVNFYKIELDNNTGYEKKVSCNSISRDETDKEIRKLLGTADDFLMTAFSTQESVNRFVKEGATARKQILSRFMELDLFEKVFDYAKEDHNQLLAQSKSLSQEISEENISKLMNERKKLENSIEENKKEIEILNTKKEDLQSWIVQQEQQAEKLDDSELENIQSELNDLFQKQQDKDINISKLSKKIVQNKEELNNLNESIKQYDIKSIEQKKNQLNDQKYKLNELKVKLSNEQSTLKTQQDSVRKLDVVPCGDMFPTCPYIVDAHENKDKVDEQQKLVDDLLQQYQDIDNVVGSLLQEKLDKQEQNYNRCKSQTEKLQNDIQSNESKLNLMRKELESIQSDIEDKKETLEEEKKKVDLLKSKEYKEKKKSVEDIKENIESFQNKLSSLYEELGKKKEHISSIQQEKSTYNDLVNKIRIYNSIQNAFSKNGIPAMVLKKQLPMINQELSRILEGIANFNVSMETDTSSNVMDVFIEDSNNRRIIELASGMEKTIASIAIRVALINISNLSKPDMFIIDEGFGSLDQENLQSALSFLQGLRNYFNMILVISHIQEVKECADMFISIENNGKCSYLNC